MTRRFRAVVEYDGTEFAGFQVQRDERTVQGALEAAIMERTGRRAAVQGAGRTDAGVHALRQVVTFEAETSIPSGRLALALNSALPEDVVVRSVREAETGFDARFSASSRMYGYLVVNRRTPSALARRYAAFVPGLLDTGAMAAAAGELLGENDFASFANELEPGATSMRDVRKCEVVRLRRDLLWIRIEANAFLRGMCRTIAGTLLEVGAGKRDAQSVRSVLAGRDRSLAGPTAPARGLCLLRVRYGQRKDYGAMRAIAASAK